ncbi:MAG: triose-phosphate isomerase, partial [Oscillospiraceae bacterium]|nr:triose-phosphate isomerase [Oscillospiraceae bacterium]
KDGNIEFAEMKNSRFCAVVSECDFSGSEFHRTNLSGDYFESSDMSGAYFEEVNLSGAGFERSNISGAAFTDVNLRGAAFEGCDLSGVEITDCKLDGMTVNGYDSSELIEFYKNNHKDNGNMKKNARKAIIAGNWKMNKTRPEAKALLEELKPLVADVKSVEIVACVPFTNLETALSVTAGTNIKIGAENCHFEKSGAFTGEISADMLAEMGVEYVVLGHSERRQYFNETDETVNKRTKAALAAGLKPIVCVGELLWERECNITEEVIARQIKLDFFAISADDVKKCVIAYEPVWAIGTGKTATAEQAEEVCAFIRAQLAKLYSEDVAEAVTIQYGGSMNAKNAEELVSKTNVDGGLIGGASLKAEDFTVIIKAAENG